MQKTAYIGQVKKSWFRNATHLCFEIVTVFCGFLASRRTLSFWSHRTSSRPQFIVFQLQTDPETERRLFAIWMQTIRVFKAYFILLKEWILVSFFNVTLNLCKVKDKSFSYLDLYTYSLRKVAKTSDAFSNDAIL